MKLDITKGTTSKMVEVFIQDSSSTTGAGLTGLVFNSAGLTAYYYENDAALPTNAITLVTMTVGTYASGGFIEVDSANMPGLYSLGIPDAALDGASNTADSVVIMLKGATNMAPVVLEIQLVDYNPYDAVRLGLTALPNAAADAPFGLPISDAGGLDMDAILVDTNSLVTGVNVTNWAGQAATLSSTSLKPEVDTFSISDNATSANNLEESTTGIIVGNFSGTPTQTSGDTSLTAVNDTYIGRTLVILDGPAAGEITDVTDYAQTNGVLTYTALVSTPNANDNFVLV